MKKKKRKITTQLLKKKIMTKTLQKKGVLQRCLMSVFSLILLLFLIGDCVKLSEKEMEEGQTWICPKCRSNGIKLLSTDTTKKAL